MRAPKEGSIGALLVALVALGLLGAAYVGPWFEYDFSTGRQTPPDGPQPEEETGVERSEMDFYATHWEGDVEPSDEALAERTVWLITNGILVAGIALALVVLGEVPGISYVIRRPVSLVFIAVALAAVAAVAVLTWSWLPESMAGHGVDSQYTSHLEEPSGYTHSTMAWGWYSIALAGCAVFAAGLFKFQAGAADPHLVEEHAASGPDA